MVTPTINKEQAAQIKANITDSCARYLAQQADAIPAGRMIAAGMDFKAGYLAAIRQMNEMLQVHATAGVIGNF